MRDKLAETLGNVYWSDLRAHAARDAIIIVAEELDLVDVGVAMAENDVPSVSAWIEEGKLTKPTAADLEIFPLETGAQFQSLIIAPYVLMHRPTAKQPS